MRGIILIVKDGIVPRLLLFPPLATIRTAVYPGSWTGLAMWHALDVAGRVVRNDSGMDPAA
jgi:hypothetical protein